ncbi:MAG: rod shape-determining protein RodA [Bacillota bacterium]|nr:rod shape-determining protein RodA [Bacillota bacterium]
MERKRTRNFDFVLLISVLALFSFGLVVVFSATRGLNPSAPYHYVIRQAMAAAIGLLAGLVVAWRVDYHDLLRLAPLAYAATLLLLGGVLVAGRVSGGAERWISIGGFSLQPSELAKTSLILVLAHTLADSERVKRWSGVIRALAYTALPVGLVLLQPDLGTAITLIAITFGMLYFAGAQLRHLAILGALGAAAVVTAVVGSIQGWLPILKPYQVTRLVVFLDPYSYQHDAGWNVIQSMIAIGSGSFFGKGLFAGSQTQLNFVPARHTDFIFSVIGEEFGFVGGLLVLSLFALVFWRCGRILLTAKDRQGSLIVAGVVTILFVHVLINVGMTLGVMPVTGLPLPFISYGGTAVMTTFFNIGLVLNVGLRRKKLLF